MSDALLRNTLRKGRRALAAAASGRLDRRGASHSSDQDIFEATELPKHVVIPVETWF